MIDAAEYFEVTPRSAAALAAMERGMRRMPLTLASLLPAEVALLTAEMRKLLLEEFKHGTDKDGKTHDKSGSADQRTTMQAVGLLGMVTMEGPGYPLVEFGSQAHVIEASSANALHFEMNGEEVFAKSIHHPGYHGDDFVGRAMDGMRLDGALASLLDHSAAAAVGLTPGHEATAIVREGL